MIGLYGMRHSVVSRSKATKWRSLDIEIIEGDIPGRKKIIKLPLRSHCRVN